MDFIDLKSEYKRFKRPINKNINKVLASGIYFHGEQTEILENNFKDLTSKQFSIAVNNATDGLKFVVQYLLYRNPERTIICPNFTAIPTVLSFINYTKNFTYCEIDNSFTIDVNKLPDIKDSILIAVNLFGNMCNFAELNKWKIKNNATIIEDCAQSCGYGFGIHGDYSVFSFYPTKNLSTAGDGGVICTNDILFKSYMNDRVQYNKKGKLNGYTGINSRINEIQAAIVNAKFKYLYSLNNKRIEIASQYNDEFTWDVLQSMKIHHYCIYHIYPILINNEIIKENLKKEGIPFMIHYPYHVSEIPEFKEKEHKEINYRVNDKILSLPIHPYLIKKDILKVKNFLNCNLKYFI